MSGLSFLKNVQIASNAALGLGAGKLRTPGAAKNPETADLRIYKNGAVYPSVKLATNAKLEYQPKDSEEKGFGFDVFSSKKFLNTASLEQHFLFIALVPKSEPKVDLFSSTVYDTETGLAKSSVLDQGATTAGKEILAMIEEAYGITIPETGSYIDLKIVKDQPFTTDDNTYWVPKVVSRGEKKGDVDLVKRKDLTLYALVPVEMLEETVESVEADKEENVAPVTGAELTKQEPLEPTIAELEAEAEETPAPAAELPEDVLPEEEDDLDQFDINED